MQDGQPKSQAIPGYIFIGLWYPRTPLRAKFLLFVRLSDTNLNALTYAIHSTLHCTMTKFHSQRWSRRCR